MADQRDEASNLPQLHLPSEGIGALDTAISREWLVTNGMGGYAMGTVAGIPTRCYHAYLIAAPRTPQERIALVTKIDETVTLEDGTQIALGADEYADGTIAPQGYERLNGFALDGAIPCFSFDLGAGLTLEKRLWMEHNANLTYVHYRLTSTQPAQPAGGAITLRLSPYLVCRDHHASQQGNPDWRFALESGPSWLVARATPTSDGCRLTASPAVTFTAGGEWYWHIEHRVERSRGLVAEEDVYLPGVFSATLAIGETLSLALAVDDATGAAPGGATLGGDDHETQVALALDRERARQAALLLQAGSPQDEIIQRLTLAADQFIVGRRPAPATPPGAQADPAVTVIAGYPWFTDWGRDTMIALPGLTLATGRTAEARGLLRGFLDYMSQGMIPNRFPDNTSNQPEYNTVDATLWLFSALEDYRIATDDWPLIDELFPTLDTSITWHIRGARYGIGVDAADGLLRAGTPGVQLTWMDAKVGDWVVTPRSGKPIEISALWYRALRLMAGWAAHLGRDASPYTSLAEEAQATFAERFWYPEGGYFCDVINVDGVTGQRDTSLRPNQVIALAVAPELASGEQARSALTVVERELLAPLGLRTLAPDDPHFQGTYGGDQRSRDGAYHQGTVWPWLIGVYADAREHAFPDEDAAETRARLLAPVPERLQAAGVGSISEILWGAAPFTPDGCPAQAWSVAEALRLARRNEGAGQRR